MYLPSHCCHSCRDWSSQSVPFLSLWIALIDIPNRVGIISWDVHSCSTQRSAWKRIDWEHIPDKFQLSRKVASIWMTSLSCQWRTFEEVVDGNWPKCTYLEWTQRLLPLTPMIDFGEAALCEWLNHLQIISDIPLPTTSPFHNLPFVFQSQENLIFSHSNRSCWSNLSHGDGPDGALGRKWPSPIVNFGVSDVWKSWRCWA